MKTFSDNLRAMPVDTLDRMIERQEKEIAISQRDLETMKRIRKEKS